MELVIVRQEDRERLWNINQKYLYEMTNYYDDEMDSLGNLHYGYFDAYFTDPKRKALFLYEENVLVGFAMIHPYSNMDEEPVFSVRLGLFSAISCIPIYHGGETVNYTIRSGAITKHLQPEEYTKTEQETKIL